MSGHCYSGPFPKLIGIRVDDGLENGIQRVDTIGGAELHS